jgi:hypothetical protein
MIASSIHEGRKEKELKYRKKLEQIGLEEVKGPRGRLFSTRNDEDLRIVSS